jgi:hypothetical protein
MKPEASTHYTEVLICKNGYTTVVLTTQTLLWAMHNLDLDFDQRLHRCCAKEIDKFGL